MEIPQLGATAKARLVGNGVKSTYQILGWFLHHGRNVDEFKAFLDDMEAPPTHTRKIAEAVRERVSRAGVKLQIKLPDHVIESSRMDDDKCFKFLARAFNQSIEHDFEGLGMGKPGKPSQSVANLRRANVATTDQLFGLFLDKFDEPITESSVTKVTEFYRQLGELGVAHGYKSTIIDALQAQLDIGIDRIGAAPPLDTVPESPSRAAVVAPPSVAPGTDQAGRRRRPGVARTPDEPVDPPPSSVRAPSSVGSMRTIVGAALVLGTAYLTATYLVTESPPAPPVAMLGM